MKNKFLKLKQKYIPHIPTILIILFLIVIVVLVLLSMWNLFDDKGILANVATELIGILVTILIVEYFIRRYELNKWSKFKELFQRNMKVYVINIFIELQVTLNLPIKNENNASNISKILDHKSQILGLIKQKGLNNSYSFFRSSNEILENLISLAKINPEPDMITVFLNIKSNMSNLSSVANQNDDTWNKFKYYLEDATERTFIKSLEDLSYLEKNYLIN